MAYERIHWENNSTALSAENMNNIEDGIEEALDLIGKVASVIYPVGSIYMSTVDTDPGTFFGGTWVPWGEGRVPVGVDAEDTNFNEVEKEGGEETVTLNVNQIPSHNHSYTYTSNGVTSFKSGTSSTVSNIALKNPEASVPTGNTGGGQSHNNLQPYITCYMFKRTA